MSNEIDGEVKEIASRLNEAHGPDLSKAACLVTTVEALFFATGMTGTPSGDNLLAFQRECVAAWLHKNGIDTGSLDAAVAGLQRGAETARYLDALPA